MVLFLLILLVTVEKTSVKNFFTCVFSAQALFEQCDEALFVGGVGVEVCELCKFAVVPAEGTPLRRALSKSLFRSSYAHGTLLKATCWSERYSSLPRTNFEQICANGKWLDRDGADGFSQFSCIALVQVVSSYYQDLDSRNWQELYASNGIQHILLTSTYDELAPRSPKKQ